MTVAVSLEYQTGDFEQFQVLQLSLANMEVKDMASADVPIGMDSWSLDSAYLLFEYSSKTILWNWENRRWSAIAFPDTTSVRIPRYLQARIQPHT